MSRRADYRRVKVHRSYEIAEAARLLGVHKNTVRGWVRRGGLPALTDRRPHLILGSDLRSFLIKRRRAGRCKCPPDHLYCLKCRAARLPAGSIADFIPSTRGAGNVRGICPDCGTLIHRRCSVRKLILNFPDLEIEFMNTSHADAGTCAAEANAATEISDQRSDRGVED